MKNILSLISLEHLSTSWSLLMRRFPLPTVLIFIITAAWLYLVNVDSIDESEVFRIIFTGVVTFFLSVGVILYTETEKSSSFRRFLPIVPILYGVGFYFTVHVRESVSLESFTYFLLHLIGFLSLIFFAPYITRICDREQGSIEYANYFSRIAWVFLMSGIVGVSIMLLGFIAIGAVDALFSLSWDGDIYGNWATLALSLIAPLYALIELPIQRDIETKKYETNRFFAFLIRSIATPAIYVYFAILYAYSIQVLVNFSDWPKGMVSWLVIGFSSFGYLTYIFSQSYADSRIVSIFRRYFPYVVIPQIAMLAYAIWLRIAQYDLTMNRYFVVIFGLWLLGISLYYIISTRKSLTLIPASLATFSLVISLGPWSVFSYPLMRQEARLIHHLEAASILQGGKIVPLKSERDISKELSTEIAGGIEYLCSFDDCARIREIFPEQVARAEEQARIEWQERNKDNTGAVFLGASTWDITNSIFTELRVHRYPYDDTGREFLESEYLSYNIDYQKGLFPLDVAGYDRVLQVTSADQKRVYPDKAAYPYVVYDAHSGSLSYYTASGVVDIYPLTLGERLLDSATVSPLDPSELTFTVSDDAREIRLVLQSFMVKNPRYTGTPSADLYIDGASGYALIKDRK